MLLLNTAMKTTTSTTASDCNHHLLESTALHQLQHRHKQTKTNRWKEGDTVTRGHRHRGGSAARTNNKLKIYLQQLSQEQQEKVKYNVALARPHRSKFVFSVGKTIGSEAQLFQKPKSSPVFNHWWLGNYQTTLAGVRLHFHWAEKYFLTRNNCSVNLFPPDCVPTSVRRAIFHVTAKVLAGTM